MKQMDIRDAAAKYLAYRSRTCVEMERHLLQKGFAAEDAAAVVAEFTAYGYLDDAGFCHQYFDYAFGKGKGKSLVFRELKEKGVDSDTIQLAFEDWEGEYSEKDRAMEEAAKVLRMAGVDFDQTFDEGFDFDDAAGKERFVDEKLLARVARRLQSKGYSSDVIYSVIGALRR